MSDEIKKQTERRKGPDLLIKWVRYSAIVGWLLFIVFIILIDEARPPMENFFHRLFKANLRKTWDDELLKYVFYILAVLYVICAVSFVFNVMRHRRKTDNLNISIIILGFFSFVGSMVYLINAL